MQNAERAMFLVRTSLRFTLPRPKGTAYDTGKEVGVKYLAFGEILFDVFPDKRTLGGAPLNVAAHLSKLGGEGAIVSAVGDDELGREARKEIMSFGLDESYLKTSAYPTGRADISLVGKNADYTFNEPCAWDDITLVKAPESRYDLIYFGTLAQRGATSRDTLEDLLSSVPSREVFFDVNIRKRFYTEDIIHRGLEYATILKMNDEELPLISSLSGGPEANEERMVRFLMDEYRIPVVLLTKGKHGSTCYQEDKKIDMPCGDVPVADTVGAGDSLSAGFLTSYLATNDAKKALAVGSTLADYVCAHRGAIPPYDQQITRFLLEQGIPVRR
jgi:fructokinase